MKGNRHEKTHQKDKTNRRPTLHEHRGPTVRPATCKTPILVGCQANSTGEKAACKLFLLARQTRGNILAGGLN
jgi:hypothetical protein